MKNLAGQRVIVVGGGIAGLAAGFRLKQRGCDVTVLERNKHVGGRMTTLEHKGYRIDTAASILPTGYTQMRSLIADAGLADQILPTNDIMGVLRDGTIHRLRGLGAAEIIRTKLLGIRSKLKLAGAFMEVRRYRNDSYWYDMSGAQAFDTETAGEYAQRRLTEEVADYLVDPLCRDLFLNPSGEVAKVDFLFLLAVMAGSSFFNSARGIGFLTEGLASQLHVELGATVNAVEEHPDGVRVHWSRAGEPDHTEHAAAAVIALPATLVPPIYPQLAPEQAAYLQKIAYSKSIVVSFGLAQPPRDEPAMWLHLPGGRHATDLIALILEHNKAPGRVPPGRGMITTYWLRNWSERRWEDDDERLARDAVAATAAALPSIGDQVEMTYVRRWDPCVAVRPAGGLRALRDFVRGFNPDSRVQLAGDYFSVSCTNSSLCSGERTAARLADALGKPAAMSGRLSNAA